MDRECLGAFRSAAGASGRQQGSQGGVRGARARHRRRMNAPMAKLSEPGGSYKGARERQERRERAPRGRKIGSRAGFAAKAAICKQMIKTLRK